jgi:hypothetical protein
MLLDLAPGSVKLSEVGNAEICQNHRQLRHVIC